MTLGVRGAERPPEAGQLQCRSRRRRTARPSPPPTVSPATPARRCRQSRWPGRPARATAGARRPCRLASMPTDQNGTDAMSTAVRPLVTNCSAHTTKPLPTTFIRKPSRARLAHMRGPGSRRPVTTAKARAQTPRRHPAQAGQRARPGRSRAPPGWRDRWCPRPRRSVIQAIQAQPLDASRLIAWRRPAAARGGIRAMRTQLPPSSLAR